MRLRNERSKLVVRTGGAPNRRNEKNLSVDQSNQSANRRGREQTMVDTRMKVRNRRRQVGSKAPTPPILWFGSGWDYYGVPEARSMAGVAITRMTQSLTSSGIAR